MTVATDRPLRVVSLLPSVTEIIFSIGAGSLLVGRTHECDYPEAALGLPALTATMLPSELQDAAAIDRHVRASVHAGSSLYALDSDALDALEPDLIITQELCAVCAVSYELVERAAKRLRSDPRIISLEPSSLEDVFATIAFVGDALHSRAGADALLASLRARVETLRTTQRAQRPRVLVLEWTDPPMSGGHWTPDLVDLAGGEPILAHPGANSQTLDWPAIAASDPDAIIVVPCGYPLAAAAAARAALDEKPAWRALRAVRTGRVLTMDGNAYVNRPGPRLVDSAEIMAQFLHETSANELLQRR